MKRILLGSSLFLMALTLAALAIAGCESAARGANPATHVLAPCPGGPHCVCSDDPDESHRVDPIAYASSQDDAHQRLLAIIHTLPRSEVVSDAPDYVHATVTTALMRYTDDLEFAFDDERKLIHVRSTSRIGYYDFGTNRARVEDIRKRFAEH